MADETLLQFVRDKAEKCRAAAKSRRDSAEGWRTGSERDHREAHAMAERMQGRRMPYQQAAERKAIAEREERIAAKDDAERTASVRAAGWPRRAGAVRGCDDIQRSRLRNRVYKLPFGRKVLLFRRGNFSARRVIPLVERGPFGCWQASWRWGQLGWELMRWI